MLSLGTQVALETGCLGVLRAFSFYACRKYLLRHLYHDLQDLSATRADVGSGTPLASDIDSVELETLPAPSIANTQHAPLPPQQRPFHSTLSRGLFSLCFSESCLLFLLLMCQALDMLKPRTRLLNWNISLSFLLMAILLLIPLSYSLVLSHISSSSGSRTKRPSAFRMALSVIPVGLFLFFLSFIPVPEGLQSSGIIVTALSRLTVLGTSILGLLSGFGAIEAAWTFFPRINGSTRSPTDADIQVASEGLQRVQNDLAQRRMEMAKLEAAQPASDSGWFSRVVPGFRGNSQLSSVIQELSGLEALEYQMSRNLETLKQQQADAKFSKTLAGKLYNWGGRLFAVYCVYRILSSMVNLIIPSRMPSNSEEAARAGADMISMALASLFSLLPAVPVTPDQVASISRQISLGLVGAIILSSIRRVLRGVARALRVTSRNLGASLMLLILAQLMGIYLLSTLVQLRTSFPPLPTRPDMDPSPLAVNLFSTLPEYQLFGSLFDGSFLLAAGGSALVRWFSDRLQGAGEAD